MSCSIFSKNCELLKSGTSWIFRVIHWTSFITCYFKPIKYPLFNNNMILQRFIIHINFKLYTSFFSNYHFVKIYRCWRYLCSVNFCLYSLFFKFWHYVLSYDSDFENLKKQKGFLIFRYVFRCCFNFFLS